MVQSFNGHLLEDGTANNPNITQPCLYSRTYRPLHAKQVYYLCLTPYREMEAAIAEFVHDDVELKIVNSTSNAEPDDQICGQRWLITGYWTVSGHQWAGQLVIAFSAIQMLLLPPTLQA
ncbi:MAG: hypothetical protein IPH45_21750 [Bacteroidales bacterium]|nr:hypothetical protein [Bacteroidales bacterium]